MIKIDNILIETKVKEIVDANILEVEVGTTGYKGGDTGHGGRTYLKLQDRASTDIRVRVDNGDWMGLMSEGPIEIAFGGDAELDTFIEALEFAVKTLKEKAK